jgi:hypothetical protein
MTGKTAKIEFGLLDVSWTSTNLSSTVCAGSRWAFAPLISAMAGIATEANWGTLDFGRAPVKLGPALNTL